MDKKLKEGYNYPIYPNHKYSKFLLIYIRKYLIKKKSKIKKDLYPDYIYKNSKDIENKKRYFRGIASNYYVNDNNMLYYKYKKKIVLRYRKHN